MNTLLIKLFFQTSLAIFITILFNKNKLNNFASLNNFKIDFDQYSINSELRIDY